ncbi:growth-regulating factor 10-like [Iris pallida]|uniref:Growth-regulating factor n=1 Tax=Iris pallida TaxID=29817 RepID=A0AAX6HGV5_IRIPA|nr:growth-regulating factor 10-like [Iris pallida]KAJ6840103.1 growth-regulating factor 10-like [Iris pallida]KAJ6840104.1 growth-regulating factor 10-like [Iris pallida]
MLVHLTYTHQKGASVTSRHFPKSLSEPKFTMAEEEQKQHQQQQTEEVGGEESEEEEEDSHPPPSKVARVSSAAADPSASTGAMAAYAALAPVVLGLGLGGAAEPSSAAKPSFTFMQRQELHHHLRIFDYIVRRAPVPLDLVLPIWRSVAASFGPHHYPSFVGLGNLCYDFRNSMEPEPGRCRRTDGKKWRCSREVIPKEKYCERHMHRGRVRSRKPVEAATDAATVTVSPATGANAVPIGSSHTNASAADPPATSVS